MNIAPVTNGPSEQRSEAGLPVHFYKAFGLTIRSDVPLIELVPSAPSAQTDLIIALGHIDWPVANRQTTDSHFDGEVQYLHWDTVGSFRVTGTDRIDVAPATDSDPRLLSFPLLGPVMALVLHARRRLVLHASAIRIDGSCAIFLGDKGAGKSTTAACLIERGHDLVSDDVVAIDFSGPLPAVLPAFPQLKLTSASANAVALPDVTVGEQLHPAIEKRQHHLEHRFAEEPAPISAIYVLERASNFTFTRLSNADSLASLLRFSYLTRFKRDAIRLGAAQHLAGCAQLAAQPGVQRLQVAAGLHGLPTLAAAIECNIAG